MTQEGHRSFRQKMLELLGRYNAPPQIPFDETSILTQPEIFTAGIIAIILGGYYLPLPAMTAAIITFPDGQKKFFQQGGVINLPSGTYTIQYVDLRERTLTVAVTDTTRDGPKVSLTVSINYKVNDLFKILDVARPLGALLTACEAAVRRFITTHHHHEIIGEPGNEQVVADHEIIKSIKEQVAQNQACRVFVLMDILIKERYGDPTISTLKHEDLVQEKKNTIEREGIIRKQEIAEEQQTLALIEAETVRLIQETQAAGEANRSEILERARRLSVELEYLQKLPELEKEKLEIIGKALDEIIHTQNMSGFPRDVDDRLLQSILDALLRNAKTFPQIPPGHLPPHTESPSTIINLLSPKKKNRDQ